MSQHSTPFRLFVLVTLFAIIAILKPTTAQADIPSNTYEIVLVGHEPEIETIATNFPDLSCMVQVPTSHLKNLQEQRPLLSELASDSTINVIVCDLFEPHIEQPFEEYLIELQDVALESEIGLIVDENEIARLTWSPKQLVLLGDLAAIQLATKQYSLEFPYAMEKVPATLSAGKLAGAADLRYAVAEVPFSADVETIANQITSNPSLQLLAERIFMTTATARHGSFGCTNSIVDSHAQTVDISAFVECREATANVNVFVLDTSYGNRSGSIDYIGNRHSANPNSGYQVYPSFIRYPIRQWIQMRPFVDNSMHGDMIIETIHAGAPQANIISLPVLNQGGIGDSDALSRGLLKVVQESMNSEDQSIVNLSLAVKAKSASDLPILKAILDTLEQQGVILIGAAGNDAKAEPYYPARFQSVSSVGAANKGGHPSCYTNREADFYYEIGDDSAYPDCDTKQWVQDCAFSSSAHCFNMWSPSSTTGMGISAAIGSSLSTPIITARATCLAAQGMSSDQVIEALHQP